MTNDFFTLFWVVTRQTQKFLAIEIKEKKTTVGFYFFGIKSISGCEKQHPNPSTPTISYFK